MLVYKKYKRYARLWENSMTLNSGMPAPGSVGIVGYGAVGSAVGAALLQGRVPGAHLAGVLVSTRTTGSLTVTDLPALVSRCEIVVEAAGVDALRSVAPVILGAGRTLLAVSVGGFLAEDLWPLLGHNGPGRLVLSTGAIGGLDLVRAARLADPSTRVSLVSRKRPLALVQPWMSQAQRTGLLDMGEQHHPQSIFLGSAVEAARLFPANLNVAAALAIAVGDVSAVVVELIADPSAARTVHDVEVNSTLGEYRFTIANRPSPDNPATSAVVPWSVLRCLGDLAPTGAAMFC
jgi:aspartate dehydrogenase